MATHPTRGAVEGAFGGYVDYGQVVKVYGYVHDEEERERRYSSPQCISTTKRPIVGDPDMDELGTSHVGTAQPYHAYVDATLYPAHKRLLEEVHEPCLRGGPVRRLVQFHPAPQEPWRDPCNGLRPGRIPARSTMARGRDQRPRPSASTRTLRRWQMAGREQKSEHSNLRHYHCLCRGVYAAGAWQSGSHRREGD